VTDDPTTSHQFGERRTYYNNFAGHLLNAYSPNMTYPGSAHRWSDSDWCACIDMVAGFGYNVFEFWLVPRLFCRQALESDFGREFSRRMNVVCDHAHRCGIQVEFICGLATVGDAWHTYCPNVPSTWDEIRFLWDQWTRNSTGIDIVGISPGDPGACSRNGCTALTYIDKSCEIAERVKHDLPSCEIELHTWGPPFLGWGNYLDINPTTPEYHTRMVELRDLLTALAPAVNHEASLHPAPETYRRELLFFAQLLADLSGPAPDFDALAERYWQRVYSIYDQLGEHVDPRPRHATRSLVDAFRKHSTKPEPVPGKWSE